MHRQSPTRYFWQPAAPFAWLHTAVGSQERSVVQAVLHKGRFPVQDGDCCDATSVGVNPQPIGRIEEFGVSVGRKKGFTQSFYNPYYSAEALSPSSSLFLMQGLNLQRHPDCFLQIVISPGGFSF